MEKILITGSGGLVGSEAVRYFAPLAREVIGIDNNSRGRWFGETGSVESSILKLGRGVRFIFKLIQLEQLIYWKLCENMFQNHHSYLQVQIKFMAIILINCLLKNWKFAIKEL